MRTSNKRIEELNKQKLLWMIIAMLLLIVCIKQYTLLDDNQDAFKRMEVTAEQAQHQIKNHQNEIDRLQKLVVSYENQVSVANEEVRELSTSAKEDPNNYYNGYTYEEVWILEHLVESEATGGSEWHKLIIANVVLNRVSNQDFPNTVIDVAFQHRQFSVVYDTRMFKVDITNETKNAVRRAIDGEDNSQGALYFMNPVASDAQNVPWFSTKDYLFALEGHNFYK